MEGTNEVIVQCNGLTMSGTTHMPNQEGKENGRTPSKDICNDNQNLNSEQVEIHSAQHKMSRCSMITINKPLIPLKIALFCWFSGYAALSPFILIYLKQLGLSLDQLSLIFTIQPFIQFFGPAVSGIVADKLGSSKSVLQANLLLALLTANGLLLIPAHNLKPCNRTVINCYSQDIDNISTIENCSIQDNNFPMFNCIFNCSSKLSSNMEDICFRNYISECILLPHNLTLSSRTFDHETNSTCNNDYDDNSKDFNNTWCSNHELTNCTSVCAESTNATNKEVSCESPGSKTQLFILSFILMIPLGTFVTSSYRIFDVTSISMVNTYHSDFGRQRIWSILGSMISPLLAGYIISVTSLLNGPPKYNAAFYLFDALVLLTMVTVWKLDVAIDPPAKDMLRKAIRLMKNVDVLAFLCTVLALGTIWSFLRVFSYWYLQDLGASSVLIGLIPAVGGVLGLPFLFTSSWFVEKIGSGNLLVLALIGYTIWCVGYSFLINPWWALIFQIFEIPTYHLLWVSVVTYSHSIAPPGLTATVIAIAGGLHYVLGKGIASLTGGMIMSKYGGRIAFRVLAAISASVAALYALYLYIKKKQHKKQTDHPESGNVMVFSLDKK